MYVEIIARGRTLGDPIFPPPEARQAMPDMREIVEGDWNAILSDTELNVGVPPTHFSIWHRKLQ